MGIFFKTQTGFCLRVAGLSHVCSNSSAICADRSLGVDLLKQRFVFAPDLSV